MNTLIVGSSTIYLHFEPQKGKNNRPFRYVGLKINDNYPERWVDRVLKHHWIYTFIYIDTDELLEFEFDYNDKFLKLHNDIRRN